MQFILITFEVNPHQDGDGLQLAQYLVTKASSSLESRRAQVNNALPNPPAEIH